MRGAHRAGLVAVLVLACLLPAAPAGAASIVGTFSKGVLTITGTPRYDFIQLTCSTGVVALVNPNHPLTMKTTDCPSVKRIVVVGLGGNDQLSTSGINAGDFTALTRTVLKGGAGKDQLVGGAFPDTLVGGSQSDWLTGFFGDDALRGGPGMDTLEEQGYSFGSGNTFTLTDTALTEPGLFGSDTLSSIEQAEITGSIDNDTLDGQLFSGGCLLSGEGGSDTLLGCKAVSYLQGGNGADHVYAGPGTNLMSGGQGNDDLWGGPGRDIVGDNVTANVTVTNTSMTGSAEIGTDSLSGVDEVWLLGLGGANMTLNAGAVTSMDVSLFGADGSDTLIGGSGNDRFSGGASSDSIVGGGGNDTLLEEEDSDQTLTDSSWTGSVTDWLTSIERATLVGGSGNNRLDARDFSGKVTLEGLDGKDTLLGTDSNDLLKGGNGNDVLKGFAGDDKLIGGAGSDSCLGGSGSNTLKSCNP